MTTAAVCGEPAETEDLDDHGVIVARMQSVWRRGETVEVIWWRAPCCSAIPNHTIHVPTRPYNTKLNPT